MQMLIAFALLLIAGMLFYQFVEREHKIVLAKVLAGTAILFGAGLTLIVLQAKAAVF